MIQILQTGTLCLKMFSSNDREMRQIYQVGLLAGNTWGYYERQFLPLTPGKTAEELSITTQSYKAGARRGNDSNLNPSVT